MLPRTVREVFLLSCCQYIAKEKVNMDMDFAVKLVGRQHLWWQTATFHSPKGFSRALTAEPKTHLEDLMSQRDAKNESFGSLSLR